MRPDFFRAPPPTNIRTLSGQKDSIVFCPFSHAHQRGRDIRTTTQWSAQQSDLCAKSIESLNKSAATPIRSNTNPQQTTRGAERPSSARGTAARNRRGQKPAPHKTEATNPPARRFLPPSLRSVGGRSPARWRSPLAPCFQRSSCVLAGLPEGLEPPAWAPSGYRPASGAFS